MKQRIARGLLAGIVLFAGLGQAKDKQSLPAEILNAHTVAVVMYRGSEMPLASPGENRSAVNSVESAIMRWGRFTLSNAADADLIIAVRKGRRGGAVLTGGDHPVILNPTDDGVHVGGSRGTPPYPVPGQSAGSPRMTETMGPADDVLMVYRGPTLAAGDPLNAPALWRFSGKNVLDSPSVPAIAALKKAIELAEKKKP
jgi:hypothetical protein